MASLKARSKRLDIEVRAISGTLHAKTEGLVQKLNLTFIDAISYSPKDKDGYELYTSTSGT